MSAELGRHEVASESPDRLAILRGIIDALDERIVELVALRMDTVIEIGRVKEARGEPVFVPGRHAQVVEHYMDAVPEGSAMTRSDAVDLSEIIQSKSRAAQLGDRLAGGGMANRDPEAAYAELLANDATLLEMHDGKAVPGIFDTQKAAE